MAVFYPRRQTVVIFAVCLMAVSATAYYSHGDAAPEGAAPRSGVTADIENIGAFGISATSTDWRKQFFSDSSTSTFKTPAVTKNTVKTAPTTATDLLGREFITKYAEMYQAGLTTDSQTVDSVASQLVSDSLSNVKKPVAYTMADIHQTSSADTVSLGNYAKRITAILTSYIPDQDHNEAVIAENALDSNDMSILKSIDPVIANYRTALKLLLSMNVPAPLAEYHLQLVNGVNIALFNAESLRLINTDPVRGMAAISMEMTGLQTMNDAMNSIETYFINAGVPFSG